MWQDYRFDSWVGIVINRQCLGQNFALHQIAQTTSRILQHMSQSSLSLVLSPYHQPPSTHPPEGWKRLRGRGQEEKCWVYSDVVLGYKVSERVDPRHRTGANSSWEQGGLWITTKTIHQ
jgi:hypothetical protein